MGLYYRKSKTVGPGRRATVSKRGLTVSQRVGPLTLSSRGRGSFRIAPGLSYRFGGRKQDGLSLAITLVIVVAIAAFEIAAVLLIGFVMLAIWGIRWIVFGTQAILEKRDG